MTIAVGIFLFFLPIVWVIAIDDSCEEMKASTRSTTQPDWEPG